MSSRARVLKHIYSYTIDRDIEAQKKNWIKKSFQLGDQFHRTIIPSFSRTKGHNPEFFETRGGGMG